MQNTANSVKVDIDRSEIYNLGKKLIEIIMALCMKMQQISR